MAGTTHVLTERGVHPPAMRNETDLETMQPVDVLRASQDLIDA